MALFGSFPRRRNSCEYLSRSVISSSSWISLAFCNQHPYPLVCPGFSQPRVKALALSAVLHEKAHLSSSDSFQGKMANCVLTWWPSITKPLHKLFLPRRTLTWFAWVNGPGPKVFLIIPLPVAFSMNATILIYRNASVSVSTTRLANMDLDLVGVKQFEGNQIKAEAMTQWKSICFMCRMSWVHSPTSPVKKDWAVERALPETPENWCQLK